MDAEEIVYRIFTDATADWNEELSKEFPQITVIPMEIMVGSAAYQYGTNEGISTEEFYVKLRNGEYASTSQITPMVYYDYFSAALEEGFDILYLCFSSGLSSTYYSALMASEKAKEDFPDRKVVCIDTLCAAVGEGLLVCEAAKKQMEGMELQDLALWVEQYCKRVCHWFVVDSFEHLKHGGRVSGAAAAIGTALNIKPLLHVTEEGTLQVKEKPRGRKQAIKSLVKKLKEGWTPGVSKQIFVGHGDSLDRALELKAAILAEYPAAEVRVMDIGAVIGSHTGPGVLAMIYWGKNR